MKIENESTFLATLRQPINLFIGAGFSTLAADRDGRSLPTAGELKAELLEEFNLQNLASLDLGRLCTVISHAHKTELDEFLIRRFTVADFDKAYYCLEDRLNISSIFTTNIDDLIYRIFERSRDIYISDIYQSGPVYGNRRAIEYIPLHGSVRNPDRPMRFGVLDIASSGKDPDHWYYLQDRILRLPTLIWGCSISDAPILQAILPATSRTGPPKDIWILVHSDDTSTATIEYFKALNFRIIKGDTAGLLKYISSKLQVRDDHVSQLVHTSTVDLFPDACIPPPTKVPSRPITEFFKGSAPMWSDIYSGSIYRTSHYETIQEAILSGDHVIITGIPGSGKTTLLMQLAAHMDVHTHKLIYSELSKEEAMLVIRRLAGQKAVVFLDNFTNDADMLSLFHSAPNIRVVAADRDYALSTVLHIIPRKGVRVINVTELTEEDLQGSYFSIPASIRSSRFVRPEVTSGIRPSLFEFVQNNITEPKLIIRFREALRRLRRTSPRLAEMLLLVSYVHACRTPVSMDMAIAYWRGKISDYKEIYDLVRDAGSLLTEYEGDLADEPQDYFAARSLLAAEAILEAARPNELRAMLLRFHANVSPMRICHYHIFRRRAYDHKLIGPAFCGWQEGAQFYDRIYARDENPYVLQHKALFLSNCKRHQEAFSVIDKALARSQCTNWTIRNSHAIIMFRANIEFASEPKARSILDQSLAILRECYDSDRRKAFHAMTFADLALQYWDAYRDEVAEEYLRYARQWLVEQQKAEPWLNNVLRLIQLIDRRL